MRFNSGFKGLSKKKSTLLPNATCDY